MNGEDAYGAAANAAAEEYAAYLERDKYEQRIAILTAIIDDGLSGVPCESDGIPTAGFWMGHSWALRADKALHPERYTADERSGGF